MTFDEAIAVLGQDEQFRAMIYAMNTLLISKGVYSTEEFQKLFTEYAINFQRGFRGNDRSRHQSLRAGGVAERPKAGDL